MPHYTGDLSRSWLVVPLLILYLLDLGGVGFLGPDEPRYASIAREMTRTGDLITPRLDGNPWFEKPPLLYWMIAAGRSLRLPDEWAARLPGTLVSLAFLVFFFHIIMREFTPRIAIASTTILSTSAGWLGYSFAATPDLPMSATLGAAMLIAAFNPGPYWGYAAGALLGTSILAKGFVPLLLFAPMFVFARGKRLTIIAGCVLVAAPWYVLCWMRNGSLFWQEFFWKHHVERFFSSSLQHVQPFWYYVPVILAGVFPWTPLAALLPQREIYQDIRLRFMAAWLGFGFLIFSLAQNKLPGYALPLLPAFAVLLAVAMDKAGRGAAWWLTASALLLVALPMIVEAVPDALLSGLKNAPLDFTPGVPFLLILPVVWWLAWRAKALLAVLAIGMAVLFGTAYLKGKTFPILDERVSVRGFWRANQPQAATACLDPKVKREWQYGLNYYAGHPLPECSDFDTAVRIATRDGRLSLVRP